MDDEEKRFAHATRLFYAGNLVGYCDYFLNEARTLERAGERDAALFAWIALAKGYTTLRSHDQAQSLLLCHLPLRDHTSPFIQGTYYNCLATIEYERGNLRSSLHAAQRADELFRRRTRTRDRRIEAHFRATNLWRLAIVSASFGEGANGRRLLRSCRSLAVELADPHIIGNTYLCTGYMLVQREEHKAALEVFLKGLYSRKYLDAALPPYMTGELIHGVGVALADYWRRKGRVLTDAVNPSHAVLNAHRGLFGQVLKNTIPCVDESYSSISTFVDLHGCYPVSHCRTVKFAGPMPCHICGEIARVPETDHVFPRKYGGTGSARNLAPAHRSCNASKGARFRGVSKEQLRVLVEGSSREIETSTLK